MRAPGKQDVLVNRARVGVTCLLMHMDHSALQDAFSGQFSRDASAEKFSYIGVRLK